MPIFEYTCTSCGKTEEFLFGITNSDPELVCSACGSPELKRNVPIINIGSKSTPESPCGRNNGCCGGYCPDHT